MYDQDREKTTISLFNVRVYGE